MGGGIVVGAAIGAGLAAISPSAEFDATVSAFGGAKVPTVSPSLRTRSSLFAAPAAGALARSGAAQVTIKVENTATRSR